MLKVCVIGCNAFTGGYVVDELLRDPEVEVIGIDRIEKDSLFVPYHSLLKDVGMARRWRFRQFDLNKDVDGLVNFLREEQPDYVMNLAALSEVAPSWKHPEQWFQTNVVALTRLVDGVRDLPNLRMFTQVSTPEVYGNCEGLVQEDYPLNPSTPYAASKAAFDLSLMTFIKNYGFPANFTRAANVYGAHQQLFKIIPRTFIYLTLNKKIPLHGGGTAVRSFTHVRDVARAYIMVLLRGAVGEVYHISTKEMVEIRDIVHRICDLLGRDFTDSVVIEPARPGHDPAYTLDFSKIEREMGWQPSIGLSEGLLEVKEWIEQSWDEIQQQPLEYIHKP